MTRKTLVDRVDEIEWGPTAAELMLALLKFSVADQNGAAIVVAAAALLAREFPSDVQGSDDGITLMGGDFAGLILAIRNRTERLQASDRPSLHVVGGTDLSQKGI